MEDQSKRIYLWSGPRNISTALMYSFAQRSDTQVYDEPLYGFYLNQTAASEYHPGAKEILNSMENNGEKVVEMMTGSHSKPVVFFKHMTHHLLHLDRAFMKSGEHIILTRDPKEMLISFSKVIAAPTLKDVGYADHLELLDYFKDNNISPIVLDSKRVLENPEKVLSKICQAVNIPFDKNMLHWEKGPLSEDGVWAKYWYTNVHNSTGFLPYRATAKPFPKELIPLLTQCEPIYNKLMKRSI